jgi:hypothetical protein
MSGSLKLPPPQVGPRGNAGRVLYAIPLPKTCLVREVNLDGRPWLGQSHPYFMVADLIADDPPTPRLRRDKRRHDWYRSCFQSERGGGQVTGVFSMM